MVLSIIKLEFNKLTSTAKFFKSSPKICGICGTKTPLADLADLRRDTVWELERIYKVEKAGMLLINRKSKALTQTTKRYFASALSAC